MQMALCSFLSLTGPSPWPQAVIKAVISSYSLKESARPWEGFREESERARWEGGRQTRKRRMNGDISTETTFPTKSTGLYSVFIIVVFPPSLTPTEKESVVRIYYNRIFYDSPNAALVWLPVGLLMKKQAVTSDSRVQIEVTLQFVLIFTFCKELGKSYDAHRQ